MFGGEMFGPYLGQAMALLTAITWALAVILFRRSGEAVHPIGLNLFKDLLAIGLLLPTLWILGESVVRDVPARHYWIMLLSGVLGIGISDTLFFICLNVLGAGRSAIVDCLYSPFVIGRSILFLNETLSLWQVVGSVMIISAVLTALIEREPDNGYTKKQIALGVMWGALAMAGNAAGIVLVKPVLNESPVIWVTFWRLTGGFLSLVVILPLLKDRKQIVMSIFSKQRWGYTVGGSFMGAYLSMILWLVGMKFTQASIAAVLNQTSNIFIFILAAIMLKEKITPPRLLGIILGVGGALIVTFL